MDSDELTLWATFAALEPFGPRAEELRAGVIASAALASRGGKVGPAELFPSLKPSGPRSRSDQAAALRAWLTSRCPALTPIPVN